MGKTPECLFLGLFVWKHPHARGEDSVCLRSGFFAAETPPRTWGRRIECSGPDGEPRNTPTHVGKTSDGAADVCPLQKHPHARGEDLRYAASMEVFLETPPRTWGRLMCVQEVRFYTRNTPTHVGKTNAENHGQLRKEKHPHARGEDQKLARNLLKSGETPPRTWGRHDFGLAFADQDRNTPTHVGKTKVCNRTPEET